MGKGTQNVAPTTTRRRIVITVFRTVCNTDWKSRPDHELTIVGVVDTQEQAIKLMNDDVHGWMSSDVTVDDYNGMVESDCEPDDDWVNDRKIGYLKTTPEELKKVWTHEDRWEMTLDDEESPCRKFAEVNECDRTTTVYHFITP